MSLQLIREMKKIRSLQKQYYVFAINTGNEKDKIATKQYYVFAINTGNEKKIRSLQKQYCVFAINTGNEKDKNEKDKIATKTVLCLCN